MTDPATIDSASWSYDAVTGHAQFDHLADNAPAGSAFRPSVDMEEVHVRRKFWIRKGLFLDHNNLTSAAARADHAPAIRAWCDEYCSDPKAMKSFRAEKRFYGWDKDVLRARECDRFGKQAAVVLMETF